MNYQAWIAKVPQTITDDSLWKVQVYRFALFLSDVAWQDTSKLMRDQRMLRLADQLYNAVGSIGANIAEGYSRGTGKDRARFYEYALGSAGESRDWYFKGRHVPGDEVTFHRLHMLTEIIRLLLVMVPQQRSSQIREEQHMYEISVHEKLDVNRQNHVNIEQLLQQVPLPE